MDPRSYWDQLNQHDWTYEYSDDAGVYRRGRAAEAQLRQGAQAGPQFAELFEKMRAHYLADYDTRHLHPKPERP